MFFETWQGRYLPSGDGPTTTLMMVLGYTLTQTGAPRTLSQVRAKLVSPPLPIQLC